MKKIDNWEDIQISEYTESEKLKLGGRMCIIKNVKNYNHNGIDKVSLELDIDEEENKDFYQKKYDERSENAKFWDDGATISFVTEPTEDRDKSYIKGLIKAIESYNIGYTWNWDETTLKNKKIGANFSLKEYQGSDGEIYTKPQVNKFVNSKENFKPDYIPKVRLIDSSYMDYESYKNRSNNLSNANQVEIKDEDMPFEL